MRATDAATATRVALDDGPAPARPTRTADPERRAGSGAVLAIILISYFMILLDNSVIFTGLPSIRASLDLTSTQLSWVQDAYTLVFGGLLLLGARAGDIVGRRRLFMIGLGVFGAASLLIGLAPTGSWMIAGRTVQGIGAAIVAPSSLALITAYFMGEQRNRAVAWYAATAGIGASLGLLVGGALTTWVSWRAAFLVNVPIAVALAIPRLGARSPNAALLAAGVAVTLVGMAWLSRAGIDDSYLLSAALPMALVGAGQGLAFAPLTNAGLAGVAPQDAGAASGMVNTAHQLGMALGLGVLVALSAHAGAGLVGPAVVAGQVQAALLGSTALLAAALLVVVVVILPARRAKGYSECPR